MSNQSTLQPWHDCIARLVGVAAGRTPADLVIRDGRWVNVYSGEIIPHIDVAIAAGRFALVGNAGHTIGPDTDVIDAAGRFALVGNAGHTIGPDTDVIDAAGRYLLPGLCDGHMHVESGMVTATDFPRAVIPHGTTSMFVDPHEIGNVLGLAGVRLLHDEAAQLPINMFVQMPSCVPSAPGLENSGAGVGPDEVREAMTWPNIIGLGEVMNFPGVAAGDRAMLGEIAESRRAGKTVGGHYASPDLGVPFLAYAAGGAADDHEGTTAADAVARVRQGMRAMLRLGSAWYDVAAQIKAVTEQGLDPRNFILCTDDSHSGTLVNDGHMNRVVRHAIAQGVRPIVAIQMATLNTAQHFGLERELGAIAPGRRADLVVSSDLVGLPIELVIARGRVLARDGKLTADIAPYGYPASARNTVRLGRPVTASDFDVAAPAGASHVHANVIGVIENQAPTRALVRRLPCRVASRVAHDSHHIIGVGTSKPDMALAVNRLGAIGGGIVVFCEGRELALVELPIAGLMSDARAEIVAAKAERMIAAMAQCGCRLNNAYMQHSLLALVVIPELRISDVGLVDVRKFAKIPLLVAS